MKIKLSIIILALTGTSVSLTAAPPALPAPLPEFMNQQQLDQWTAKEDSKKQDSASTQDAPAQFYTGKPYVADVDGYIYSYRTYNPEMSRWTTADPSGFPDGVNNFIYAKNEASYSMDDNGLATLVGGATSSDTTLAYSNGKTGANYDIEVITQATNSGLSISFYGVDTPYFSYSLPNLASFSSPDTANDNVTGGGTLGVPTAGGLTGTTSTINAGFGVNLSVTTSNITGSTGNPELQVNLSINCSAVYDIRHWTWGYPPSYTYEPQTDSETATLSFIYE